MNSRRILAIFGVALLLGPALLVACVAEDGGGGRGASGALAEGEGDDENATPAGDDDETNEIDVDFTLCETDDCGPPLGMPNWLCDDGTIGGPTGACVPTADGRCGWEIADCEPDDDGDGDGDGVCTECPGPAPGMPNWLCDDGTIGGPACLPDDRGECGWVIVDCPVGDPVGGECESCPGPAPGMPNWLCPDGESVGGPACQADEAGVCRWFILDCP